MTDIQYVYALKLLMTNVAFLFGAGASIGALPIVNQIPRRLEEFIDVLRMPEYELSKTDTFISGKTQFEVQQILIDDLLWLLNQSARHASVDTFAKKLFLTNENKDLVRLKLALSVFFIYEQLSNMPDNRYDVFFASLLRVEVSLLPENIRILSWNYDYQFEMAYSEFSKDRLLKSNQYALNIIAKYNRPERERDDCFTIFKLNGATNIRSEDNRNEVLFLNELDLTFDADLLVKMLEKYSAARARNDASACTVSFAWEGYLGGPSGFINDVAKKANNTEILVVIGYSFPFFNREVDRKIIGGMEKLRKIYIQSPEAENIQERFESIIPDNKKVQYILKKDTYQFFMPNEL